VIFTFHTVFSDGSVWPLVRVGEAYRDGLDAIAITDHLEYTPGKAFIPVNHNAAWEISKNTARDYNIILVQGAEITRAMPPGHINALFIHDASLLAVDSVMDVCEAAIKQGGIPSMESSRWNHRNPTEFQKCMRYIRN
jgi:hypothetical protein